ncbi:hypothetical protein [Demetria terragena]|uniref:hypothetical protein n=1 Tax=Demetria terragena TaxID=63959 RepID=UPI000381D484|nr:hypothetical protein [Demetria terragena]
MATRQAVLITGLANPTHLIYVGSYLRQLAWSGPIELFAPPGQRIDLRSESAQRLLPHDLDLTVAVGDDWMATQKALVYVSVGAPGLRAYTALRRRAPRRAIEVVVTDEGLGTYGTWRTRRQAGAREGVREPWRTVRPLAVSAGARLLTSRRWPLYARNAGRWTVCDDVAEEFRRHISDRWASAPDRGRVVLLTQPWPELGVLSERDYLAHVDDTAAVVAQAGRTLSVCPHPLERPGRYADCDALDPHTPAELNPVVVHAAAVLGGPSTALLNLAAVHGVPAVRIGVPGRPDLDDDLCTSQRTLLQEFVGAPVARAELAGTLADRARRS